MSWILQRVVAERSQIDPQLHAKTTADHTATYQRLAGDHICKEKVMALVPEVASQLQMKSIARQLWVRGFKGHVLPNISLIYTFNKSNNNISTQVRLSTSNIHLKTNVNFFSEYIHYI